MSVEGSALKGERSGGPGRAVFLSYASQDAEAAKRICDALRQAGVEVWFDQSELRGGDAWDAKIRKQIKECALFVPIISATTNARPEGYFRLEWKLAVDRSYLLAEDHPFLFPIAIGDITEATARVPEKFREVQWTRLRLEETPTEIAARVNRLLAGETGRGHPIPLSGGPGPGEPDLHGKRRRQGNRPAWLRHAWSVLGLAFVSYYLLIRPIMRRAHPGPEKPVAEQMADATQAVAAAQKLQETVGPKLSQTTTEVTDKSVAVLAFANLSDDKGNEYFSDGISEELLNVLAKMPGLKVTARTSAFHFKGKDTPVPEIAKQLGVAYVVEGSVRKSDGKVRITAQLIKASDGFHVWSDTFTRDLKDIFAMQDEIAGIIARSLSVKLGADFTASTVVNPQAFELYMQGRQAWNLRSPEGFARAEQLLNRAIEVSPGFSRAQVALADVAMIRGENAGLVGAFGQRNSSELAGIVAQIQRVLALDPDSAEAHASLGNAYCLGWNFVEAERSLRRAIALNPNYATAHQWLAFPLYFMGRVDEALSEQKRAAELDPLSPRILDNLGHGLRRVGRYREALPVFDQALALQPNWPEALGGKALTYVALNRSAEAVALVRQLPPENLSTGGFQILVFGQTGLRAEAEALLARWDSKGTWSKVQSLLVVGRREEALAALDASQERLEPEHTDVLLDPLFDPIRGDPRFAKFIATLGWTEAHARAQAWRATHPPEKLPAN